MSENGRSFEALLLSEINATKRRLLLLTDLLRLAVDYEDRYHPVAAVSPPAAVVRKKRTRPVPHREPQRRGPTPHGSTLVCENCFSSFYVRPSRLQFSPRYCGRPCAVEGMKDRGVLGKRRVHTER